MDAKLSSPLPLAQRCGASLGLLAALATVLLWASSFPMIRLALNDFDPLPLAALRFAVAALLMGGGLLLMPDARPLRPRPQDRIRLLGCAGVGIVLYSLLLNSGQRSISAGAASFIVNTAPALTALLSFLLLRERFRAWAWAGMAISLAGVALIASQQTGGLRLGAGAPLVLGAALCLALFFVLQRPLLAHLGGVRCAAWLVMAGAFLLTPWLPEALRQASQASTQGLWALLFLAVFPGALGYLSWSLAQAHYGAARAASFLYLVPPAATALSGLLLGEIPGAMLWVGGTLALGGVVIVNRWGRPR